MLSRSFGYRLFERLTAIFSTNQCLPNIPIHFANLYVIYSQHLELMSREEEEIGRCVRIGDSLT